MSSKRILTLKNRKYTVEVKQILDEDEDFIEFIVTDKRPVKVEGYNTSDTMILRAEKGSSKYYKYKETIEFFTRLIIEI